MLQVGVPDAAAAVHSNQAMLQLWIQESRETIENVCTHSRAGYDTVDHATGACLLGWLVPSRTSIGIHSARAVQQSDSGGTGAKSRLNLLNLLAHC